MQVAVQTALNWLLTIRSVMRERDCSITITMRSPTENDKPGIPFRGDATTLWGISRQEPPGPNAAIGFGNSLAFAGLYLFTFLLYARPNDLLPSIFGAFPIVKMVAVLTALTYGASMFVASRPITIWPLEVRMLLLMVILAVLFMPFAVSPQDSVDTFSDSFFKIVLIFVLIINLVNSYKRLHSLLKLLLTCASALAVVAIRDFLSGKNSRGSIEGVGGMFSNPNDFAAVLALLIPLAVALALSSKGGLARLVYVACSMLLSVAVLITFSRGAFLGLIALGGVLLWRLRPRFVLAWIAAGLLMVAAVSVTIGSGNRLSTILNPATDETGSAQERQFILQRAAVVAVRHSVIGVGIGNFHHYSFREKDAHNAYLEVWAELGMGGLIAYLTLILAPFRSLRDLELKTAGVRDEMSRKGYHLSVGLQATLAAYIVCSFFGSLQYQWYLYYPVAFAISLRIIHGRETSKATDAAVKADATGEVLWSQMVKGTLWPEKVSHGC
jgi:O-antigen ligase